ncbi:MAG TPA: ATP-binding protein [Polyangia bacterium]
MKGRVVSPAAADVFVGGGEMAARMRALDWSKTAVGPVESWPQSLKVTVRLMLTSRYAMWMGWGQDFTFFCNDAYLPTLGIKQEWALGASAREVWAEIWKDVGPRAEAVLRTGVATWDEGLLLFLERRGFAEETYHTFSYSPVHTDAGEVGGMLCVVTEETERTIGERRLRSLRELAAATSSAKTIDEVCTRAASCLTNAARDLPFLLLFLRDADTGRVRLAGQAGLTPGAAAARMTDETAAEGWRFDEIQAGRLPLNLDDLAERFGRVLAGPWPEPVRTAIVVPLNTPGQDDRLAGFFVAGISPRRPLDENYRGFLGLLAGQVTSALADARAYDDERKRAQRLTELDRAKTAFFSNVSHEFRTPLTLMLGPLEDALGSPDRSLEGATLESVHRNTVRLLKLVNSLLDFSRIEAGRTEASYEATDLATLTTDLASAFRSAVERAGLTFEVSCPPLPQDVYVDRTMWEKIVLNLISNALKFTFEGSIAVRLHPLEGRVRLTVEDTGIGIAEGEIPRLFERFYRVHGARSRSHEGTGIGLALVAELVRLHGGSVGVQSESGIGTRFVVEIPYGNAHANPTLAGRGDGRVSTATDASSFVHEALRWLPEPKTDTGSLMLDGVSTLAPSPTSQARGHILLADDNADMREYVGRLIGAQWSYEAVSDGLAALEAVRRRRPDLILTDVMMPGLDGFELLRALRADAGLRLIPVIMLSARAGEEARVEGLQAGADDYLVKPFSARELIARVSTHLQLGRLRGLAESGRRKLHELFMQAPIPVAVMSGPDHVFALANPSYCQMVGRTDVIGKTLREALPELDDHAVIGMLDQVYQSGQSLQVTEMSVPLLRPGAAPGEPAYVNYVVQPVLDDDGGVQGVMVMAADVTDQVLARQRVDELRKTAEDANRAKDEFLAMLGHELRNPLAPITTALQLMRLRAGNVAQNERTVIERQVAHLTRLVDDLLDVSRITRGKVEIRKHPVEMAEVVVKAIEMASPLLERRQHQLDVHVAPEGLMVEADLTRLAQVVANLLTNAAKYTDPGGRIVIRAGGDREQVWLSVRDNGIGIDAAVLPHVFELFMQERQSIDRSQGGLGLGLAIVRSLVALHGGTVTVDSGGKGRGSEFTIHVPRSSSHAAAVSVGNGDSKAAAAQAAGPGLRVLIVDDNEDAAGLLAEALSILGHDVRSVNDGPKSLEVVEAFVPDVAFLDIGLPVMDGYELARRLRSNPRLAKTRLVAITGYGQESDKTMSSKAGFDLHLVKPVTVERLESVLRGVSDRVPTA